MTDDIDDFVHDDFIEALIWALIRELEMVYSMVKKETPDDCKEWQVLEIPGLEFRRFFSADECDCGAVDTSPPGKVVRHLPHCSTKIPNLSFDGVTVRWHRSPGRGLQLNVRWDERRWRVWFDAAIATIRAYERAYRDKEEAQFRRVL